MYVVHAVTNIEKLDKILEEGLRPPVRSGVKNCSLSTNPYLIYFSVQESYRGSIAGEHVLVVDEDYVANSNAFFVHTYHGTREFEEFVRKLKIPIDEKFGGVDDEFWPNQLISPFDIPSKVLKLHEARR